MGFFDKFPIFAKCATQSIIITDQITINLNRQ